MFQQDKSGKWKITIDKNSLSGGWGFTYASSPSTSIETKSNQYAKSTGLSFLRPGFEGHISAGEGWTAFSDTNSTLTSLPLNGTVDSSGNGFSILKGGRIAKLNFGTGAIDSTYDIPSAVSSENNDITSLKDVATTPVEYLIYSYNTSASGSNPYIGYVKPDFTGSTPTWITIPTSTNVLNNPIVFSFGPTKNDLYFTNGQYIGTITISGALASATTNVNALNLGSGWATQSICSYGNYIAIVGHRSNTDNTNQSFNESKLWLWDGYSPDPNFVYDLGDNYVSRVINDNGVLKVWTKGRNNTVKIKYFTGSKVETLFESAQIGNFPRHGSVDIYNGYPHFAGKSGQYLDYIDKNSFHRRSFITDGTNQASDIGMVKNLYQNYLYVGLNVSGNNNKIFYIDTSTYYPTAFLRTRLFSEIPPRSKIKGFRFYFSQFGTGASLGLSLFKDYNTVSIGGANDLLKNLQLTNTALGNIRYHHFDCNISDLNSFFLHIVFNHATQSNTAAIIRKIEILGEATDMY